MLGVSCFLQNISLFKSYSKKVCVLYPLLFSQLALAKTIPTKEIGNKAVRNPVKKLLTNTSIQNKDFEKLLISLNLTKKDFVFLDPPYDTEFSEYEENAFTRKDQERLAKTLIKLKAKWILIIKETEFILNLYKGKKGVKISRFDKNYLFQIRSRIDTKVRHLIIHNLDKPIAEQKKLK